MLHSAQGAGVVLLHHASTTDGTIGYTISIQLAAAEQAAGLDRIAGCIFWRRLRSLLSAVCMH